MVKPIPLDSTDERAHRRQLAAAVNQLMRAHSPAAYLDVYLSAPQSVADSTWAVIKFDTVVADTLLAYNASTGKYTPTTAGKYLVRAMVQGHCATTTTDLLTAILKNGAHGTGTIYGFGEGSQNTAFPDYSDGSFLSGIVSCNGITDTIEVDSFLTGTGGSNAFYGSATGTGARLTIVYIGP